MNFKFYRSTDPASEPVTTTDMEEKLSFVTGWNSTTLAIDIEAARIYVEDVTDRSLINQSWTGEGDYFPDVIHLPKGPISSVTSVKYVKEGATSFTTLVEDTDYIVEIQGDKGRIYPISSGWPTDLNNDRLGVVQVIYVAGYGANASDVPGWAKSSIMLKAGDIHTNGALNMAKTVDIICTNQKLHFDYNINEHLPR